MLIWAIYKNAACLFIIGAFLYFCSRLIKKQERVNKRCESQMMRNTINSLKAKSNMSNSSINELFAHSSLLELPKKHILTSSFQNDKNFYFIEKGIARSYCVINDKELTSWFSTEGDIVFSLLENTVLYAVPIKDLEKLYQTNIEIANWSRILHQEAFIMNEKRLISRLYKSAEERYIELLQTRPDLFQRVNLGYIASFLGISQVTLCHLRNKIK